MHVLYYWGIKYDHWKNSLNRSDSFNLPQMLSIYLKLSQSKKKDRSIIVLMPLNLLETLSIYFKLYLSIFYIYNSWKKHICCQEGQLGDGLRFQGFARTLHVSTLVPRSHRTRSPHLMRTVMPRRFFCWRNQIYNKHQILAEVIGHVWNLQAHLPGNSSAARFVK